MVRLTVTWLATLVLDGGAYFGTFARMVDNASELAARLSALKGAPGYKVESKLFV